MIPYQELCGALARWREQRGLVNGPSANPPPPLENPPLPGERTVVAAAPGLSLWQVTERPLIVVHPGSNSSSRCAACRRATGSTRFPFQAAP